MLERIQVLGPGTILPLPGYGCSGYVLFAGAKREPILVDCGSGTLDRLAAAAIPVEAVRLVLLTHFHPDHVADLAPFLLSRWLRNLGQSHELTIVGPVGLRKYLDWLTVMAHPWIDDYRIEVVELGGELSSFRYEEGVGKVEILDVQARPTIHTESSICYRITDETGRALFYSGDTDYDETLEGIMKGAALALVECSMPEDRKLQGHLTPRLAARLAARAAVQELLLTHFYEEVLAVDILAEARAEFSGKINLARELATYYLR